MKARLMTSVWAACAGLFLTAGTALADGWPATAAGNWSVVGNHHVGALQINQFPGAPGSQCKPIRGVIYGADAIEGFYCPGSGRIAFVRFIGNTNNPKQHWMGNLSQNPTHADPRRRIGGTFTATDHNNVAGVVGGSLGEYNFSATSP